MPFVSKRAATAEAGRGVVLFRGGREDWKVINAPFIQLCVKKDKQSI